MQHPSVTTRKEDKHGIKEEAPREEVPTLHAG